MREDDPSIALTWFTKSIDRLVARDRIERARKLHMKSLTNGNIDVESALSVAGQANGGHQRNVRW